MFILGIEARLPYGIASAGPHVVVVRTHWLLYRYRKRRPINDCSAHIIIYFNMSYCTLWCCCFCFIWFFSSLLHFFVEHIIKLMIRCCTSWYTQFLPVFCRWLVEKYRFRIFGRVLMNAYDFSMSWWSKTPSYFLYHHFVLMNQKCARSATELIFCIYGVEMEKKHIGCN